MAQITQLFLRPELWLALLGTSLVLVYIARRKRLRWWPAWIMRILLIGILLLGLFASRAGSNPGEAPKRSVMLVDQSDSLTEAVRSSTWQQALAWQASGENRVVIAFGADARAFGSPPDPSTPLPAPQIDGRDSHLFGALETADSFLAGAQGTLILASDGLVSQPDRVSKEIADLAGKGSKLDVVPLVPRQDASDLAVGSLSAPVNIWSGTSFDLLVRVFEPETNGQASLELKLNGQVSPIPAEPAGPPGLYLFRISDLPEGLVTLEVTVVSTDASTDASQPGSTNIEDPFPGNNAVYATLQVFAAPRALFVTSDPNLVTAIRFVQMLTQNGIQLDAIEPTQLSTNLDTLRTYKVIFLDDLLSSQINQEQMTALQVFVSRLAGGIVFLGGRNSYTLGGYQGTLLEGMLPVKLEAPPRSQRPPMVFQLILDRSSSMGTGGYEAGITPIVLAREAAMRSIETLRAEDYLGVLTFSDQPNWDVPIQQLSSTQGMRQAMDAVSQVRADGVTQMYQAMEEALARVAGLPPEAPQSRHILVLSDGKSTDGTDENFQRLSETAQEQGISISTIALGQGADTQLMERIAEAGKGRFYDVEEANDLPRILVSESQAARSENVQTGETSLKASEPGHPILSGLSESQLPILQGYNALRSKVEEGAEDVLISSSFGDPILSAWQYGLGRVITWAGDSGKEWTSTWPGEGEGDFWSQVVRYALVNPALGPAQVGIQIDATQLKLNASIFSNNGDPLNLTDVTFTYIDQANEGHSFRLPQTSAGTYQLEIPRPADGAYRAVLTYTGEDGQKMEVPAPFAVNPPVEWLPVDAAAGQANLNAWAKSGAGEIISIDQLIDPDKNPTQKETASSNDWWWRVLLALVILWPVEIAIRRRWLPWME